MPKMATKPQFDLREFLSQPASAEQIRKAKKDRDLHAHNVELAAQRLAKFKDEGL